VDGANTYMFSPVCDVWLYKVALGKYYICWTTQQVTVHSKFRVILRIWFDIITTMIVQNTILITNFFRIESFGGRKKKICWTAQQVTVHSKFRVILRIWFDIITTMIVQNSIFITNLFRIESFGSWTCPLKRKKHPTKSRHLLSNEVK